MAKRNNGPYAKRVFLNPVTDGAPSFIQAVADSSDNGDYLLGNYLLIVADCDRRVTLEFSVGNAAARRKSLTKIDHVAKIVNGFRKRLLKEIKLIEKANRLGPTRASKTKKSRRQVAGGS